MNFNQIRIRVGGVIVKVCTQCGTKLGKKDKFCPKCGSSLYSDDEKQVKYCLHCGEELDAKAKFCRACGKACDGNVSLDFLQERKNGEDEDTLDFLKKPARPAMTSEELAKEKATLARFEAQIRDNKNAKAAQALKTPQPVQAARPAMPMPGVQPARPAMPMPGVQANIAQPASVAAPQPASVVAPQPASVAAPQPIAPAEKIAEFEEEKLAIENAKNARAEAERAKAQAENAKETARRAKEAALAAEESANKSALSASEAEAKAVELEEEAKKKTEIADAKRKELEAIRLEEERKRKEEEERRLEEERKRKEEEERKRKEEEERLRREEEERRRREEEERLRREEEERKRKEEEERLRREEEERRRKEEEERLRREEEERKRKEEEERLRREEEERKRKEEEAARIKAEQERRAALEQLHKDVLKSATAAVEKYDKNPEAERPILEQSLDKLEDLYKKIDSDMDVTDTEDVYHDVQERLGIMYYKEGSYKLAMPLIDAAIAADRGRACIYKAEWYSKNRSEVPKEPDFLKNFTMDALMIEPITKDEKLMLYLVLAKTLHDGIGCKRDLAEAFTYYEKAAGMESAYAYAKVGQCYLYGEGVKKDGKLAFEWSQKAADQGNETGIRNLAVCYDFGTGTKKNAESAIEWYKKLLEKLVNDRFAMYRIAHCLVDPDKEYGRRPSEEECIEAYDFASKAQAGGEERANYILGYLHMLGKGVEKDYNKAVSYFTSAANYGEAKAKEKIKLFVKNGSGNYVLK